MGRRTSLDAIYGELKTLEDKRGEIIEEEDGEEVSADALREYLSALQSMRFGASRVRVAGVALHHAARYTQCACFTSTKGRILTPEDLRGGQRTALQGRERRL